MNTRFPLVVAVLFAAFRPRQQRLRHHSGGRQQCGIGSKRCNRSALICVPIFQCLFSATAFSDEWQTFDVPGAEGTSIEGVHGSMIIGVYNDPGTPSWFTHGFAKTESVLTAPLDHGSHLGEGSSYTWLLGTDGNKIVGYMNDGVRGVIYNGSSWSEIEPPWLTFAGGFDPDYREGFYVDDVEGSILIGSNYRPAQIGSQNISFAGYIYDGKNWTELEDGVFYTGIDQGRIVGYSSDGPFIIDGGRRQFLETPFVYDWLDVNDIHGSTIVGTYGTYTDDQEVAESHGFVYDGTNWTSMDFPGALRTSFRAVYEGTIVGNYIDQDGKKHGLIYGPYSQLGTKTQSISFKMPKKMLLGRTYKLNARVKSKLPVIYSLVSGPAVLQENLLTINGSGTVIVSATQGGDAVYSPARATKTSTVTPPKRPKPKPLPAPGAEMVLVQGGNLPSYSELSGQSVATFAIGKYEVTWDEWQSVRLFAVARGYDLAGIGKGSAGNHPVRNVSWYDAVKWCNAKSEMEGLTPVYQVDGGTYKAGERESGTGERESDPTIAAGANGYRLPIKEEWEWAARGGVSTHGYTYSGSDDLGLVGWYDGNSAGAVLGLYHGTDYGTWPVGQKQANELGLHDMSGNVWEWCFSSADASGSGARFVRGGGWSSYANNCAVIDLYHAGYPMNRGSSTGFRLARSIGN
ncbi:MAG: formylglycine-generating enzyme family protein [Chthoniobacterales bacterium]|nr:formylglycine-generating enzyme family protein [Chthoniobacterales bacterium]